MMKISQQINNRVVLFHLVWFLPLISIFYPYKFLNIYIPLLLLFLYSFFRFFTNKKIKIYLPFLMFFLYTLLNYTFKSVFFEDFQLVNFNNILTLVLTNTIILSCCQYMDDDTIYKSYKIFGFLVSLGIIYHVLKILFFGMAVSPIALLPNVGGRFLELGLRPVSVFQEPASYALFLLPLLYLSVIKNDLKVLIYFSFTLLLSTSTSGVVITILVWLFYFLRKKGTYNKICIALLIIFLIFLFLNMSFLEVSRQKTLESLGGGGTSNIRVFIGAKIYLKLTLIEKIFGMSSTSLLNHIYTNTSRFGDIEGLLIYLDHYSDSGGFYTNFIFTILINYGLLGFLFFLYCLYSISKSLTEWKYYPWIFLSVGMGMNYYLGPEYIISFIIMMSQLDYEHTKEMLI